MKGNLMKKVFLLFVVTALLTSIGFVNAQDDKPITIWIDTTRQAAVDAFVKANPDKASLIKTEIVDRAEFAQKVLLFNNTGSGWPDVVFAEPDIVGQVADAQP